MRGAAGALIGLTLGLAVAGTAQGQDGGGAGEDGYAGVPVEVLIARGRKAVEALGIYRDRMVKRERVGGKILPAQTVELLVRTQPFAVRFDFVAGPGTGRRVLYNTLVRADAMRVRESGMLTLFGALWIGTDSSLAFGETNHRATDSGFSAMIDQIQADFEKAKPQGGFSRKDLGWNERGRWCVLFTAPKGGTGLKAETCKICLDRATVLPMELEISDRQGFLESYYHSDVRPRQADGAEGLTLEGAKL